MKLNIKNIKIKIVKSVKFHVISGVVSYKSGLIYKILRGMNIMSFMWKLLLLIACMWFPCRLFWYFHMAINRFDTRNSCTKPTSRYRDLFCECLRIIALTVVYWSKFLVQIHSSGFDSRCYKIFWEIVGLERSPLSLVSTTEELLGRKSIGSRLEENTAVGIRHADHMVPSIRKRWH
jgi:hypothetical protein